MRCIPGLVGLVVLLSGSMPAAAGTVEVVAARFQRTGETWRVSVTLRHEDSGWDHYADAWRIVNEEGKVLATRVLRHPHINEQPFTRSLDGVVIPEEVSVVSVEAHDKVHGWSPHPIRVDLSRPRGDRFRVER